VAGFSDEEAAEGLAIAVWLLFQRLGRSLKKNQKIKKILRSSPLQVDGNPARGSLFRSQVLKILTGSKVITENGKKKKKCRGPAGR